MLLGVVLVAGCATVHADKPASSEAVTVAAANDGGSCSSAPIRRVVEYANMERRARDLPPLECSASLGRVADSHSRDMCERQYVAHVDPDGVGPEERFDAHGIDATAIGENVAHGHRRVFQVHQGWMHSAGHRKNILHPDFRRIGVAVRWCDGRPYWTQTFASE